MSPTLESVRDLLVRSLHPRKVILFGSRATGNARPDSDVDLLVVMESALPVEDRVLLARRALRSLKMSKDVFVYTPEEFARYATWTSGIVREAIDHGLVLYEAA